MTADLLVLGEPSVAIREGRILAVGPRETIEGHRSATTRVMDLGGATLLPGLRDAHAHVVQTGLARDRIDLHGMTVADVREAVRAKAAVTPKGAWIRGSGFSLTALGAGRDPTADDLDPASPDHPVQLASHDLHALWVNRRALIAADRDPGSPAYFTEDEIRIFRDATGRDGPADRLAGAREAQREFHRHGITSVQDHGRLDDLIALSALAAEGELSLRITFSVRDHELERYLSMEKDLHRPPDRIVVNGQKMFLDGAFTSRTAWTLAPYQGEGGTGHQALGHEVARERVRFAAENGLPTFCHAIGDAAVREALDLFETAPGLPHRVEHAQLIHPDDLDRFARQGVMASVQPVHLLSDAPGLPVLWGDERARRCFAVRSLLSAGAEVQLGSDTPVETLDPMKGVFAAATRRTLDGTLLAGEETIPAATALDLYLSYPALEPGRPADLVAYERDPVSVPVEDLPSLAPLLTVFAGEVVSGP